MKKIEEMLESFKHLKEGTTVNNLSAFLYAIGINPGIRGNRECIAEIESFLEEAFDMNLWNENELSDEEIIKIIKNITSLFNVDLDGNLNSLRFVQKNTISGTSISEKIKQIKIEGGSKFVEKANGETEWEESQILKEVLKMKFTKEGNIIEGETGEIYLERERIVYLPDQTAILFEKRNIKIYDEENSQFNFPTLKRILEEGKTTNSITINMEHISETGQDRITAVRKRRRKRI